MTFFLTQMIKGRKAFLTFALLLLICKKDSMILDSFSGDEY